MRKIVSGIGVAIMVAVFVAASMAYFVYNTNPANNVIHDGFGRPLSESPFLMRLIFEGDRLWAGWLWCIADMVIFWGGLLIGVTLATWGFKESCSEASTSAENAFSGSEFRGHHT